MCKFTKLSQLFKGLTKIGSLKKSLGKIISCWKAKANFHLILIPSRTLFLLKHETLPVSRRFEEKKNISSMTKIGELKRKDHENLTVIVHLTEIFIKFFFQEELYF